MCLRYLEDQGNKSSVTLEIYTGKYITWPQANTDHLSF
jgi:hypothetical protein